MGKKNGGTIWVDEISNKMKDARSAFKVMEYCKK